MNTNRPLSTSAPHDVTSPSSHQRSSTDTHSILHNADAVLANELSTLRRLQTFYEQHVFDTQGPYADLFAVLLSSCKHLIDVGAALVRQSRTHDEALHRQQAMCNALCGEVSQQRSDIVFLTKGGPQTAANLEVADAVSGTPCTRRSVTPHANCYYSEKGEQRKAEKANTAKVAMSHHVNYNAAPSFASSFIEASQHQPARQDVRDPAIGSAEETGDEIMLFKREDATHRAAWANDVERRLEDMQEQLTRLLEYHYHRAAHGLSSPHQQQQQQQGHPQVACSPPSRSKSEVKPLPAHPTSHSSRVLMESFDEWKHNFEDTMADRLDKLTQQVDALERTATQHQRQLRWMGSGADEHLQESTGTRPISRKKQDAPLGTPPPAVIHWVKSQLQQQEDEWRQVLEDVQEALAIPKDDAGDALLRNQTLDVKTGEAPAELHGTALPNAAVPRSPSTPSQSQSRHAWFTRVITELLLLCREGAQQQQKAINDLVRQTQHTNETLHDLAARLEVLEVYAPHRYAVAAAPPVLGVELEDVTESRVGVGVRVRAVYQDYLADHAGLSVGDLIAGVGHQSVQTRAQLYVVMAELTRDYNAQCRVHIEEGYLRHYMATTHGPVDTSVFTTFETTLEDGDAGFALDQALQRARTEAASANHRTEGSVATNLKYRASSARADKLKSSLGCPSSSQHKNLLTQCLPYFELTLHVLRDGRLRDVTVLVPPSEALRSVTQY